MKSVQDGTKEFGLDVDEFSTFMDANFERAKTTRSVIDRKLMDGEWPVLLQVMGKDDSKGKRFLSIVELKTLLVDRRLPQRMNDRLAKAE